MMRRGYIEQLIEALGQVMARVLKLGNDKDYINAHLQIKQATKHLTGMELETVTAVPEETLLSLLTARGVLDSGRAVVLASLLQGRGKLWELEGRMAEAYVDYRKALTLLTEALVQEDSLHNATLQSRVSELSDTLAGHAVGSTLLRRLYRYHEAMGEFGKAEDMLYTLRESGSPTVAAEAVAFYERLLAHSDAVLEEGGLPREEIETALAELREG